MADTLRKLHGLISGSPLLDQMARSGWGGVQLAVRPVKLRRYLASTDRVRVMLGAGPCARDGWLPTDITPSRRDVMYLDARKPLPFDDGSVDLIHTEHLIEHIDFPAGQHMLRECARILRPGGRLRISTPDYDRVVALAAQPLDPRLLAMVRDDNALNGVPEDKLDDASFVVNRLFSDYAHRFLYSEQLLTQCMHEAGLADVRRHDVGESDEPDLRDLEMHGERIGEEWNQFQSLILEAVLPAAPAAATEGAAETREPSVAH
jgi:predicted SAM-dependent methyltransferase